MYRKSGPCGPKVRLRINEKNRTAGSLSLSQCETSLTSTPSKSHCKRAVIGVKRYEEVLYSASGLQRPVEERQAHVRPGIDNGVAVVEFLVDVPDAGCDDSTCMRIVY